MSAEQKQLIKNLLNSFGQKCNYMTHNLAELGDGDMAEGLVRFYKSAQLNGVVIGAGSVGALVVTYHVGKAIIEGIRTPQLIRQTAEAQAVEERTNVSESNNIITTPVPGGNSVVETDPTELQSSYTLRNSDLDSFV